MLKDQIPIDRDGHANRQLLAAIQNQLHNDYDGRLPFLLLPVRIETRFMQVDRPVAGDSINSDLLDRLGELKNNLGSIAGRNLVTRLGSDKRATVKATEKDHYDFLDQSLGAIEKARSALTSCLRNCTGSSLEDAAVLSQFAADLRSETAATEANIATLRSNFQKEAYRARLEALNKEVLKPIDDQLAAAARKLELTARLRFVEVAEVRRQIAGIRADVDRFNRNRLRDYSALKRARDTLYPALHELRADVHAIIHGDGESLRAMHSEWRQLDQALAEFQQTVAAVPVDNRYQSAGRSRTQTHIEEEYRHDLGALDGASIRRFQILSNKEFSASADAAFGVTELLAGALKQLREKPAASSRRAAQVLAIAEGMLQRAQKIDALSRDIAIIPADRYAHLTRLQTRIEDAWIPWASQLSDLARTRGRDAAAAARLGRALEPALKAQERAIFSQRIDVWDAYDRFYDDFRRKIFAVDTTPMATVDELWVRVYPDDIAVHTHEEELTEDEERDGRDFWIETHAAEADDELKRGAWRALVRLHGSHRAAWIAKVLEPTVTRPFAAGQRLLDTVRTLQRRINEVGSKRSTLLRSPLQRIERIQAATDAALGILRLSHQLTARQRTQIDRHLRLILAGMGDITDRFDRRSHFLPDLPAIGTALEKLALSLRDLQTGINALPVIELQDAVRQSLRFPDIDRRAAAWCVAPHSKVLPDRFVALAVRGGEVVHAVAGDSIEDIKVGLDPDPDHDDASLFRLDEEGRLEVGDSIRWMTDFEEAVRRGMGITIRISDEDATSGFDELFVLGVKGLSADATRALIEQLLDNHHYSEEGLGFLPLGTPTNNTDEQPAAWRSDDDPEASYEIERGEPLFDPEESDPNAKRDGLLFAEALGISPSVVCHVAHADSKDMSGASIINHALWPATMGAYIEDLLGGLVSIPTLKRLESYFIEHVSARGKLPALRVGSQPYGMVVTTAFNRFESARGSELPALPPGGIPELSEADHALRFDILLHELMCAVAQDWSEIRRTKVAQVHSENVDDAQQHFMEILGLHATSVSNVYRFALNFGGRHPAYVSGSNVPLDHTDSGPHALLKRFLSFHQRALYLDSVPLFSDSGAVNEPFKELYDAVFGGHLYDVRYMYKTRSLRGPLIGNGHASYIETLLNKPVPSLLTDGRNQNEHDRPLLFLLLRQAMMIRIRFAALNILEFEQMLDTDTRVRAGESDTFMVNSLHGVYYKTKWTYLLEDLIRLNARYDTEFPEGPDELYTYLTRGLSSHTMADYLAKRGDNPVYSGFPQDSGHNHNTEVIALQEHAANVARLKTIPKARLELLLREHIDLCSHRLDAWQLGLANRRLAENRADPAATSGLYLGAYGWVENLRPGGERDPAEELPPALHIDGEAPIYTDADNQGFIHCPSVNQAVTAAVLRSGYLTEADETDIDNRMAVNLSSRRVRLALGLLDGVQSGQDLGTLLGYRFERELHQAYQHYGVTFDDLIYDFRRAFPGASSVDPASVSTSQARRLVCDGLALLDTVNDWVEQNIDLDRRTDRTLFEILRDDGSYSGQPWGLPPIDTPRRDGLLSAIDGLADALDALSDIALAEGVFQIVQGNFPRAAAVLSALSEGRAIPHPQVVDTPRSGTTLTHHVLMPLAVIDGRTIAADRVPDAATLDANRRAALPPAWSDLPMTPRANAEPGLNRWLGELLGQPDRIFCLCGELGSTAQVVSANMLGLQPIDWLALLGGGLEEAEAELSARLIEPLLPADADLASAIDNGFAAPRIHFAARDPHWPSSAKTIYEIAALLGEAAALLGRSRPVHADDLALEEGSVDAGNADQPGWDLDELDARIGESQQRLQTLTVELMRVLNGDTAPSESPEAIDPRTWTEAHRDRLPDGDNLLARRSELARLLLRAGEFGIRLALPPLDFSGREAVAETLASSIMNAFIQCAQRLQRATGAIGGGSGINARLEATKAQFGKGFVMVPAFTPRDPAQLFTQLSGDTLLRHGGPFAMDGFLAGAASVRENLAHLQQVWGLGEAFGASIPEVKPAQLPEVADDYWLGIAFPPDHTPESDKLSLVVIDPDVHKIFAGTMRALLIDHWTETIPSREETTGVSFFYDQPDATPPQALLLAVSPRPGGTWRWDDLVHTLHDTFEIARNRAVEPEHLNGTLYAQLLPAVQGELVPNLIDDSSTDLSGSRAILDFGANN